MATATEPAQQLSNALVAFALQGRFPDDISHLPPVSETDLQPAIQALDRAKKDLEVLQPNFSNNIDVLTIR